MIFQSRGPLRSFDKLKISASPGRPMGIKLGKVVTHRDSPEILFPVRLHNPLTTWSNKKIHNILKKLHLLYHQTFLWLLNLAGWWLQTEGSYHKCLSHEWLLTPSHQYSWMDGKRFFQCFIYCFCKHMSPVLNMAYHVFSSHML